MFILDGHPQRDRVRDRHADVPCDHQPGQHHDIHGFNSLTQKVPIHTDLNSKEKIFVNWSNVPVMRFKDAPDDAMED